MRDFLGFGVVGNFAFHLEQAGEASTFALVKTTCDNAPKGIFPFYVPNAHNFLSNDCFDNNYLIIPEKTLVQAEPEVALRCELEYDEDGKVKDIKVKSFMAFNDASIRRDTTAIKVSQKKNFSNASRGFGNEILIDKFDSSGICQNFSIVSFLKNQNGFFRYGECAKLSEYNYFYSTLIEWMKVTFNTQKDYTVLENLLSIIKQSGYIKEAIISVGATRYEKAYESYFLNHGDEISIVVFNHNKYSLELIESFIQNDTQIPDKSDISILKQVVK